MARSERIPGGLRNEAQSFLASVRFDWRLLGDDVDGSLAHLAMLTETGIIPGDVAKRIGTALKQIRQEWEDGTLTPRLEWEDVHMNVEGRLHELVGSDAGYLHTARSRNDQVAVDMHRYLLRHQSLLAGGLIETMQSLSRLAHRTIDIIMPGYTHLQTAQPIVMAHHWLAYGAMFQRDYERLTDWSRRANVSPLGAGALSGTPYPTDPDLSRQLLGFDALYTNSLDAVSDRDYLLEFLSWASLFMVHVSRLSEELVLWSSAEFDFIALGNGHSTGSSIMPQKRNPDVAELLRGKSGRVFGDLMALLTVMKGLPLAYNSDMQEDKEAVFDALDTVEAVLQVLPGLLDDLTVHADRLFQSAQEPFTNATDLADLLAQSGMPFRQAHHRVGSLVGELANLGYRRFDTVPKTVWNQLAPDIPQVWLSQLTPEALVARRTQSFATAPQAVAQQLASFDQWLNELSHHLTLTSRDGGF